MTSSHANRLLVALGSAFFVVSCNGMAIAADSRVQSEMIYLSDRLPVQTCWVSEPSTRRFSLNAYFFYYYEEEGDAPCAEGLPTDRDYYAFNRQLQPELAIHVIEDLREWQAAGPDLSFLSEVPECRSGARSLGIDLISFPAITRASEIYVDFSVQCPGPVDGARARIGFSYDHQASTLTAEDETVIWR